jgi:type III secretion protein L
LPAPTLSMASIGLTSRATVLTSIAGHRIPKNAWSNVQEVAQVLQEANGVLQAARVEAHAVLHSAHEEGYAAGIADAQAEAARHLLEAQREAREFVAASEGRLVSLAIAILLRVAPNVGPGELVKALVHEALGSLNAERHLRIRVAPQVFQATQTMLEEWQRSHPEVETVTVEPNAELAAFECMVESELGHIEVGLAAQLAAIRDALTVTTAESVK